MKTKEQKRKEAELRKSVWESLTIQQRVAKLEGFTAERQRKRWAEAEKRVQLPTPELSPKEKKALDDMEWANSKELRRQQNKGMKA